MNQSQTGSLTITSIPSSAHDQLITYLAKYSRGATNDQISAMISRLPLLLSKQIADSTAERIVRDLCSLGVTANFTPDRKDPDPVLERTNLDQPKQPSFKSVLLNESFAPRTIRFPVATSYRAGLLIVAMAMILLTATYLGLIGCTCFLVVWHAVQNLTLFHSHGVRQALFLYLTPLIVGLLLIFFMTKPLFARIASSNQLVEIKRGAEPLIFAFIQKICTCVGAPMPTRICVDNRVNASASLEGGIMGAIFKRDLRLTIGLPLACGLDIKGFAGVLAHEFGHFSQSSGMRLTYIIRSINFWFSRVVFEEDEWDVRLRRWSNAWDFRIGIVFYIARFFIWLTRKILFLLMKAGNAVSCYMLRQMEFDADRYEAAMVGGDVFEKTSLRLAVLGVCESWVSTDIAESWEEGRLPDDLTSLVMSNLGQMKLEIREEIERDTFGATTTLLDTHPSTKERIDASKKYTAPPIFSWPEARSFSLGKSAAGAFVGTYGDVDAVPSASSLFTNFEGLSKRATLSYYTQVLGMTPEKRQLVEVSSLVQSQQNDQRQFVALERYFLGKYNAWLPIGVSREPVITASDEEPGVLVDRLLSLRETIRKKDGDFTQLCRRYDSIRERALLIANARALIEAGFKIDAKEFRIPRSELGAVDAAEARNEELSHSVLKDMEETVNCHLERLVIGLRLIHRSDVGAKIPNADTLKGEIRRRWKAMATLERPWELLQELHVSAGQVAILVHQLPDNEQDEELAKTLQRKLDELRTHIDTLACAVANVPYPFEHTAGEITLDDFIVGNLPERGDIASLLDKADFAVQSTLRLRARLAAFFASIAEEVETAIGLRPIVEENGQCGGT